ncbi:fe503d80-177c-433a-b6c6-51959f3d7bca [Sclerotinia trifoliorum]|uniref:Fe503d80-177c-433a-b6c6-51959f3d7bca n=1 Tax=Sclerotinia trifoliorum TaxID=28548 RepID=A0A8H2ZQD3_9HELO|nr:fe503d80-177c-433a-b6c6-51959f3d7bca [Sclerotinia trifoliorum]
MSSLPKFTFPEIFGGSQSGITSPKSPISTTKQIGKVSSKCMFIVQEYNCPHHPHLSSPHLLHRTPCWEALLPRDQQKECENYTRRDGKTVRVGRYEKERGCMDCKAIARNGRRKEAAKHAEIARKMKDLELGGESIEETRKVVDCSSSEAIDGVIGHINARTEEVAEEEVLVGLGAVFKHEEIENEAEELKNKAEKEQYAPVSTNVAEAIQSPISVPSQANPSTGPHAMQQGRETTPPTTQNPYAYPKPSRAPGTAREEHELLSNILYSLDEEFDDEEFNEEFSEEFYVDLDEEFYEDLNQEPEKQTKNPSPSRSLSPSTHTPTNHNHHPGPHPIPSLPSLPPSPSPSPFPSPSKPNTTNNNTTSNTTPPDEIPLTPALAPEIPKTTTTATSSSKEDEWVILGGWETLL